VLRYTAIIFLCTSVTAFAQRPSQPSDYAIVMQELCRQYADAQVGMPVDLMFNQCMSERHCRLPSGSSTYPMRIARADDMAWRRLL